MNQHVSSACEAIRSMTDSRWWDMHGGQVEKIIGNVAFDSKHEVRCNVASFLNGTSDADELARATDLHNHRKEVVGMTPQQMSDIREFYMSEPHVRELVARIDELESAIKETVTQKLDHICWLDVYQKLAKLVGIEFNPLLIPPEDLRTNCARFIASIYNGYGYTPDRLTLHVESLEKRLRSAEESMERIRELALRGFEIDKVANEFLEKEVV